MGMKECEGCGKQIDDKYTLCVACNIKNKQANIQGDTIKHLGKIAQQLEYINWNLGLISQFILGKKDIVKKIQEDMEKKK